MAEDLDVWVGLPAVEGLTPQFFFALLDHVGADRVLERENQSGADRLDDGRGAALLAGDRVVEVAVSERVDERDRAATDGGRDGIADQFPAHHEDPRRLGTADELVR